MPDEDYCGERRVILVKPAYNKKQLALAECDGDEEKTKLYKRNIQHYE